MNVEFKRCWACDTLVSKKEDGNYIRRLEEHHVFGKNKDTTLPLCVLCHDLLDRFSLNDIQIFSEYMRIIEEMESMPRGKYPMTKLVFLKMMKIMNEIDKKNVRKETF